MSKLTEKYTKHQITTLVVSFLSMIAFFFPLSSGIGSTSFDMEHSYNIFGVLQLMLHPGTLVEGMEAAFYIPLIMSSFLLIAGFVLAAVIFIMTLLKKNVHIRKPLAFMFFL